MTITASTAGLPRKARRSPPLSAKTKAAANWFTQSGIQTSGGAVARAYLTDVQEYRPVSTEITGYAAGILAYLYNLSRDQHLLESALRAGRFLTRSAWRPELETMPFEVGSAREDLAYFFDLGIVARGLLSLWRATGDEEFLESAVAVAYAMHRDFLRDGGYVPVIALPGKQPVPGDTRWSLNPGCYQLKAALAWLEVGEATDDAALMGLYEAMLERFSTPQEEFVYAEPSDDRVMDRLHAYCYFLEGLLPRTGERPIADLLRRGLRLAGATFDAVAPRFERADVRAQVLRLRLYAAALGVVPLDPESARREAARVAAFQFREPDPRVEGAFCFGRRGSRRLPFANPATTTFAVQALEIWRRHRRGWFSADFRELV